jgi:hypothetical protein
MNIVARRASDRVRATPVPIVSLEVVSQSVTGVVAADGIASNSDKATRVAIKPDSARPPSA